MHKRCAFKCEPRDIPMHRFPNVNKYPETFKAWVRLVGGKLDSNEDCKYYKEKRVCDIHFTDKDRIGANRLCIETVPSLHIPVKPVETSEVAERRSDNEISQAPAPQGHESRRIVNEDVTVAQTNDSASETGDPLCKKPTACRSETKCSKTTTRPKVVVLRLVTDSLLDEPVYELLDDEQTDTSAAEQKRFAVPYTPRTKWKEINSKINRESKTLSISIKTHVSPGDTHVQAYETSPPLSKTSRKDRDTTYTITPQPVYMNKEQFRLADKEDTTLIEIESPSFVNDVAPVEQELPSSGTDNPSIKKDVLSKGLPTKESIEDKLSRGLKEKDKNMCYWKMKLMYIVQNSQFCGICLDAHSDMNALSDEFEIVDNEQTHTTTLQDMAKEVFNENANIANSQICNNCTDKLIQSFIFIRNAKKASTIISSHLSDLYNKTSYILNDIFKNSNNPQSQIHNVVIAFDNNDQSENDQSENKNSTIKTEELSTEHSKKDLPKRRKMKCVSCNIILPSYRAWRLHESTTHKQALRCSVCLQNYRTQASLTKHYRTHLKTCHKRGIHVCSICNVVRYSSKNHHCDKPSTNLYWCRHQKSFEQIQRKYQCDDCPPNFGTCKDLTRHSRFTRGKHKLSCEICDREFVNDLKKRHHELKEHIEGIHERREKSVTIDGAGAQYRCALCDIQFDTLRQLTLHKHKHTNSLAVCDICGKIMRHFLLKKHIQSHRGR